MSEKLKSSQLKVHHKDTLPPEEIVDLFKTTFKHELYIDDLTELQSQIQTVKTDLYNRDYIAAFNNDVKRTAYCCRWSPSRANAYASLFAELRDISDVVRCSNGDSNILCVGGGAGGELVALAALFAPSRDFKSKYRTHVTEVARNTLNIHLIDISNWSNVISRLSDTIEKRWLYANESKYFNVQFTHDDILKLDLKMIKLVELDFISLLFTTNELFAENKAKSIRLLQNFNKYCKSGCYLLITESAGSYSHITVGSKKFPIQFLIDTVLIGKRGSDDTASWVIVHESDSTWYRGDPQLDYPMKLENMRFFYRLYKKV